MELTYDIRAEALLARLKGNAEALQGVMRSVVSRLGIEVQTSVKEDKLTGQALSVRTGTLRRSINLRVTEDAAGVVASVGTNVVYGAIHEYGYQGAMTVRAHTRGNHSVRTHTRQVNLPARSFLRSTLQDMTPHIQTTLREAALKAVQL